MEGQRVFTPIKLDKGRNVGVYAAKDRLVAGGFAWDEPQEQLPQKAFLMHQPMGQGHVIAFAEDPNYRAFAEATQLLFINALDPRAGALALRCMRLVWWCRWCWRCWPC